MGALLGGGVEEGEEGGGDELRRGPAACVAEAGLRRQFEQIA